MDAAAQDVSLFGELAGERTKKFVRPVRVAQGARRAQRAAMALNAARSTQPHEPSNEVAGTGLHALPLIKRAEIDRRL